MSDKLSQFNQKSVKARLDISHVSQMTGKEPFNIFYESRKKVQVQVVFQQLSTVLWMGFRRKLSQFNQKSARIKLVMMTA
jgi:hypothetical protein